ncbi:MAG: hypothetical protein F2891_01030 [Actinobacteria bacterium]|uniref:Unannotated protein n=1 Tax=freshwater metagenome TaxID=449393 RepID=A0A6J6D559_9ZZZZ|nr:hypothetical protein [Actinomycetota bacterium]MTA53948.1 hypothetical protein [Actinomycetota bacterium]MTA71133.1 hypothetical protein [Actinomycetota bacterium]
MSDENFEVQVQSAKQELVNWMVEAGAEAIYADEDQDDIEDESWEPEIFSVIRNDVEYFIGDATCDPSHFYELVTDKDFKLVSVSRNGHHHFEIAALFLLDPDLTSESLHDTLNDLKPDIVEPYLKEGNTFLDGSMKPSFCLPIHIEVPSDGEDNNVWVVRRFRVQDFEDGSYVDLMTEFLALVDQVEKKFES